MQICKVLNDDVENRHEHHNANHQEDKDRFGNHFIIINLRQSFVAPDSQPKSYTVLLHKHMEAPVMPKFAGATDGGDTNME